MPRKAKLGRTRELTVLLLSLVLIPVAAIVLLATNEAWSLSTKELVLAIAFAVWTLLVIVATMTVGNQRAQARGLQRRRDGIYFTLENGILTRHLTGELDINIGASEIDRIEEFPYSLKVQSSGGRNIQIPGDTDRYADLRAELDKISPVVAISKPKRPAFLVATSSVAAVAIIASLVLLPLARETRVRYISAAVLVAALTWQYVISPLIFSAIKPKRLPQPQSRSDAMK
ncbi:hypothetical protein [Candidatus Korobacter versatilis]|uniref:hypothetical protein n=1 Tax=Candidatus Korobacter versatilis TaxID=658062 RepID=UPI0011D0F4C1|nr:hypothetical protein [Candidatus Koribacter versatilis]